MAIIRRRSASLTERLHLRRDQRLNGESPHYAICAKTGILVCCVKLPRHATTEFDRSRSFCRLVASHGDKEVLDDCAF
jgi:hypothetical protein